MSIASMKASTYTVLAVFSCLGLAITSITPTALAANQQSNEQKEAIKTKNQSGKKETEKSKEYVNTVNEMVIFLWRNSRFKDQEIPRGIMSDNEDGRYNFSYYGKSASSFYTVNSYGRVSAKEQSETSNLADTGELYAFAINIICEITQVDCEQLTREITSSVQDIFKGSIPERNQDAWRKAAEQNSIMSELVAEARRLERSGKLVEAISNYSKALKIDPDNPYTLNSRGVVLSKNGDPRRAIEDYNKALSISPSDTLILMNRAMAWDKLSEPKKAIIDLDKLLQINPDDSSALRLRGSQYLKVRNIDLAFADSKQSGRLGNDEAYDAIYDYIESLQEGSEREELLSRIIQDSPDETPAYLFRGELLYERGDYIGAEKDFQTVTIASPRYAPGFMKQGMAFFGMGDTEDSLIALNEAIRLDPDYSDAINNRGILYLNTRKYKKAISDFSKAVSIRPDVPSYLSNKCKAEMLSLEHTKAVADCSKSISLDGSQFTPYFTRGRAQFALGNFEEAKKDFDSSISNGGDSQDIFYWSGLAEYQLENYKQSIRRMHQVLRLNPRADSALVSRAQSWIQLKRPRYALEDLRMAIKINPQNYFAYENEAYVLRQLKSFQAAIRSYNKAIKINPNSSALYGGRAASKYAVGANASACKDWMTAKELGDEQAGELYQRHCPK